MVGYYWGHSMGACQLCQCYRQGQNCSGFGRRQLLAGNRCGEQFYSSVTDPGDDLASHRPYSRRPLTVASSRGLGSDFYLRRARSAHYAERLRGVRSPVRSLFDSPPPAMAPVTETNNRGRKSRADERKSENVKRGRLKSAFVVGLVVIIGASCSSNGSSASNGTASSAPHASSSTTSPITSTSTTAAGTSEFGTAQTATGPAGQQLTVTAGKPVHTGYAVGGPPGSWAMGVIVKNLGPGPFGWNPSAQVTLVDSSGRSNAPRVAATATATTGKPVTVAVGQQIPVLLIFVLGPGAQPRSASFSPFGTSVAPLEWSS
jgi:hypothetical protein